jgi:hypothetical protein
MKTVLGDSTSGLGAEVPGRAPVSQAEPQDRQAELTARAEARQALVGEGHDELVGSCEPTTNRKNSFAGCKD